MRINFDGLAMRIETVAAAYLLGGYTAAGYALATWGVVSILLAVKR